jgi:hypothetical protein
MRFLLSLRERISSSLRLTARSLFKDIAAHSEAGNQPIKVICKIMQTIPDKIFPLSMKDRAGRSMASNIISFYSCAKISVFFSIQILDYLTSSFLTNFLIS